MKTIKFVKEPGYVYDLFYLFFCYYSKSKWQPISGNNGKETEQIDRLNSLLVEFSPYSDELLPFFYSKENNLCFMLQYYFLPYKPIFRTTYSLSTVLDALMNHEKVVENMIRFYFPDVTGAQMNECMHSPVLCGRLIKNSEYSSDIKSCLYAFFLEPAAVIQKLSRELMSKEFQLSQLYEKSFREIMELQHGFNLEELLKLLGECGSGINDLSEVYEVNISFCICSHNIVKLDFYQDCVLMVLGHQYTAILRDIIDRKNLPQLDLFGNALSEKNRIEILDLILRKEEATIREIEQELGFSGTNAYYHINLMIKAKMIKSQNRGRMMVYSINNAYFDAVCSLLSKYSTQGKRRTGH